MRVRLQEIHIESHWDLMGISTPSAFAVEAASLWRACDAIWYRERSRVQRRRQLAMADMPDPRPRPNTTADLFADGAA
jgi:hypothetical protein